MGAPVRRPADANLQLPRGAVAGALVDRWTSSGRCARAVGQKRCSLPVTFLTRMTRSELLMCLDGWLTFLTSPSSRSSIPENLLKGSALVPSRPPKEAASCPTCVEWPLGCSSLGPSPPAAMAHRRPRAATSGGGVPDGRWRRSVERQPGHGDRGPDAGESDRRVLRGAQGQEPAHRDAPERRRGHARHAEGGGRPAGADRDVDDDRSVSDAGRDQDDRLLPEHVPADGVRPDRRLQDAAPHQRGLRLRRQHPERRRRCVSAPRAEPPGQLRAHRLAARQGGASVHGDAHDEPLRHDDRAQEPLHRGRHAGGCAELPGDDPGPRLDDRLQRHADPARDRAHDHDLQRRARRRHDGGHRDDDDLPRRRHRRRPARSTARRCCSSACSATCPSSRRAAPRCAPRRPPTPTSRRRICRTGPG